MGLAIGCAYLGGTAAKATIVRAQAERIEGATAAGFTEEALAAAAGGAVECVAAALAPSLQQRARAGLLLVQGKPEAAEAGSRLGPFQSWAAP